MGSVSPTSSKRRPPVPGWDVIPQDHVQHIVKPPTGLSFTDDDELPVTVSTTSTVKEEKGSVRSPVETADLLYEVRNSMLLA